MVVFLLPVAGSAQPIVVGELIGQLGNQLFIIAATVSLALDHGAVPVFPNLVANPDYNLPINYRKIFFKLNTQIPNGCTVGKKYSELGFDYKPIPYQPNMRLFGYYQSEKYFAHHRREIIDLFAPSVEIVQHLETHYKDILDHPNTVAVHLRTYHREDPRGNYHITYGRKYIDKAMTQFSEDALFVVFSNDIAWCKSILVNFPRNVVFIEGEPYYHDFYLMSMCKHNIICNSTFSWWAAYLNKNPKKVVVAPRQWFNPTFIRKTKDLQLPSWILID